MEPSITSLRPIHAMLSIPSIPEPFTLTGIQAENAGQGRTFVYVAGLGGCFEWAREFWEKAIHAGVCDRVIGIDLPTYGVNKAVQSATIESTLQMLKYLVNPAVLRSALGMPSISTTGEKRWVWSAISLGAMCSLHAFPPYQHEYEGLCLFVPAFAGNPKTYHLGYVLNAAYKGLVYPDEAPLALPYTIASVTRNPAIHEAYGNEPLSHPVKYMLSILKPQLAALSKMRGIQVPTLMVTAGQDYVVSTPHIERGFKKLPPHSRHKQAHFPWMFHDVLLEPDNQLVVEALHHWHAML
jgi:alpha-beta hydrolase superfamily lysophospholipase